MFQYFSIATKALIKKKNIIGQIFCFQVQVGETGIYFSEVGRSKKNGEHKGTKKVAGGKMLRTISKLSNPIF